MATYLLLWNPDDTGWPELPGMAKRAKRGAEVPDTWRVRSSKKYLPGDPVYILKVGPGQRGIMGAGIFTRRLDDGLIALRYNMLLNPEVDEILAREALAKKVPTAQWYPRASGVCLYDDATKVKSLWEQHLKDIQRTAIIYPAEIYDSVHWEGKRRQMTSNDYERSTEAVLACKAHFGRTCRVCGFDFEMRYGKIGKGFIHVHHIKALSKIGKRYKVNAIKDLIPVCPNCHAMLHQNPPLTVEQLRRRLR
jgi:5-methylcytosine-specific restriction protein A